MSLFDLAKGLRAAGGVLSPDAYKANAAEDSDLRTEKRQETLTRLRHTLEQEAQKASPQYQMQQEALKNEKLFRDEVAGAGGDTAKIAGAAMKYGKPELAVNLINQKEARAAWLQQASDALDMRMVQINQAHEANMQRITDSKARADEAARHNKAAEELRKQGLTLQGEIAKGNQELKKLQFTMKADQGLQGNVTKLGAALEKAKLPHADAVLADVEKALEKTPEVAEFISGPKSLLPDLAVKDDVKFARQAFKKLFNITLQDRSGAAVTNQELERLKQEFATGAFKTDKQLSEAVEKARGIINAHYAGVAGAFGPDVLNAYNENIRGVGGRVVLEPKAKTGGGGNEDPLGIR